MDVFIHIFHFVLQTDRNFMKLYSSKVLHRQRTVYVRLFFTCTRYLHFIWGFANAYINFISQLSINFTNFLNLIFEQ